MPDTAPILPGALPADMPPIQLMPQDRVAHRGRTAVFSILLSVAVIAAVFHEMGGIDLNRLLEMVPTRPAFWFVFVAAFLVLPASEWLIYHRLWRIPSAGFVALLRKKVYNELLLGYLGEAYFYTWARRRATLDAAPFGAVKDVAILSAMAGNGITLLLLAVVMPLVGSTRLGLDSRMLTLSLVVVLVVSIAAMVWRRRVFTLPRPQLVMITKVHLARIALSTMLTALLWHFVLPDVALSWWMFLATLRLLVSRLPLLPNKDLLFAGIAVIALGHERDIGALMTMIAGLMLAANLLLGSLIAAYDLANPEKRA